MFLCNGLKTIMLKIMRFWAFDVTGLLHNTYGGRQRGWSLWNGRIDSNPPVMGQNRELRITVIRRRGTNTAPGRS